MPEYITTSTTNPSQVKIVTTATMGIGSAGTPAAQLHVTGAGLYR